MGTYGQTEHDVTNLFPKGKEFFYDDHHYKVIISGKPRPSRGECKTDTYIRAIDENQDIREFKISIKQTNAEFLENKMTLERAKEIFGNDAQEIIKNCIASIAQNIKTDYLIHVKSGHHTEAKSIRLGWKFELLRNDGGNRAGNINLTREQKLNVYAGTALSDEKKNCMVDGKKIDGSGIANMFVELEPGENDLKTVLDKMIPIEVFIDSNNSDLCFACKALNYRATPDKWDGDRPLAVYVDWKLEDGTLTSKVVMDKPLEHRGNEIGERVRAILKQLKISEANFSAIRNYVSADTRIY